MKANAIARIILYSILALMLIGILCAVLLVGSFTVNVGSGSGTVVEGEVTFEATQVQNIEIDWAAGSVEIRAEDTDQITISEVLPENSEYKMTYTLKGDTLSVSYAKGTVGFGFGNWSIPQKDLLITVPQDWVCGELEIDGASLTIDLQGLTIGKLDLDGASCDVFFSGSLDRLEVDGASTNATLSCDSRISSIDLDGASCDLELTLPVDCGFTLSMDGLSCDLHTDLPCSAKNGETVYGDGYCKIQVDGVSCDVSIKEAEN